MKVKLIIQRRKLICISLIREVIKEIKETYVEEKAYIKKTRLEYRCSKFD